MDDTLRATTEEAPDALKGQSLVESTSRILYVDDEPSLAALGQRRLGAHGFSVTPATSGFEAIDLLQSEPDGFDLVVTDYSMPGMNGLELAMAIYKIAPDTPVLLMSGYMGFLSEKTKQETGIKLVLQKPVNGDTLLQACNSLTNRTIHDASL